MVGIPNVEKVYRNAAVCDDGGLVDKGAKMKCVVSVLGKDRTGIVAAVATVLTECGANIDDISQTILGEDEIFSMTMLVTLNVEKCPFEEVQDRLMATGKEMGTQITLQREDVFRFMHEI